MTRYEKVRRRNSSNRQTITEQLVDGARITSGAAPPASACVKTNGRIRSLFPPLRQSSASLTSFPARSIRPSTPPSSMGLFPNAAPLQESDYLARQFVALVSDAADRGEEFGISLVVACDDPIGSHQAVNAKRPFRCVDLLIGLSQIGVIATAIFQGLRQRLFEIFDQHAAIADVVVLQAGKRQDRRAKIGVIREDTIESPLLLNPGPTIPNQARVICFWKSSWFQANPDCSRTHAGGCQQSLAMTCRRDPGSGRWIDHGLDIQVAEERVEAGVGTLRTMLDRKMSDLMADVAGVRALPTLTLSIFERRQSREDELCQVAYVILVSSHRNITQFQ